MPQVKKCLADYKARVPLKSVRHMMTRELHKTRHYCFLPFYLLFLLGFGATLFTRHVSILSDSAPYYTTESVEEHSLYLHDFKSITTKREFFQWLNKTLDHLLFLHGSADSATNETSVVSTHTKEKNLGEEGSPRAPRTTKHQKIIPIGVVAVRQMRVDALNSCKNKLSLFTPSDRASISDKSCSPMLSASTVDAAPYGKGRPRPSLFNSHCHQNGTRTKSDQTSDVSPLFFPSSTINNKDRGLETAKSILQARGLCTNNASASNAEVFFVPAGPSLFTTNYNFVYQGHEFVEFFYLHEPRSHAAAMLTWLEKSDWFDEHTKAIAIDTIHYDNARDVIEQVSFVLEITSTVNFAFAAISTQVPNLSLLSGTKGVSYLLADIGIVVGIVFLVIDLFAMAHDDFNVSGPDPGTQTKLEKFFRLWNIFTFWWGVTLFMIVAGGVCFAMQLHLWALGPAVGGKYGTDFEPPSTTSSTTTPENRTRALGIIVNTETNALLFYESVATMSNYARLSVIIASTALIAGGYKLFFYLQHVKGLNLITETLHYATRNLLSLFMIMFGMLFIYATVGTMLFGSNLKQMRTFGNCFVFMCRILVAQDLTSYQQFSDVSQIAAFFYFGTFFVFFWIVLVNTVLGIIAQAFQVAEEERKRRLVEHASHEAFGSQPNADLSDGARWNSIAKAFRTHVLFFDPRFKVDRHRTTLSKWENDGQSSSWDNNNDMLSASMRAAHSALTVYPPYIARRRLHNKRRKRLTMGVQALHAMEADGAQTASFMELCNILHYIPFQDLATVFERAWALHDSREDRRCVTRASDLANGVVQLRQDLHHWFEQEHPDVHATMPSVVNVEQDAMERELNFVLNKLECGSNDRGSDDSALGAKDICTTNNTKCFVRRHDNKRDHKRRIVGRNDNALSSPPHTSNHTGFTSWLKQRRRGQSQNFSNSDSVSQVGDKIFPRASYLAPVSTRRPTTIKWISDLNGEDDSALPLLQRAAIDDGTGSDVSSSGEDTGTSSKSSSDTEVPEGVYAFSAFLETSENDDKFSY